MPCASPGCDFAAGHEADHPCGKRSYDVPTRPCKGRRRAAGEPLRLGSDGATLGEVIRRARRNRGLTQTELAAKVGVTQAMVSKMESDQAIHTVRDMAAIAEAVGVPLANLLGHSCDSFKEASDVG